MDILNTLAEISIYAAVIFGTVILMKRVFHKKMSPVLHYAVWALLILRLMIPVTIDSSFKFFVVPQTKVQEQLEGAVYEPILDDGMLPQSVENTAADVVNDNNVSAESTSTAAKTYSYAAALKEAVKTWSISDILVVGWLGGVGIALAYIVSSYLMVRRRISRDAVPVSGHMLKQFCECKAKMGISREIKLRAVNCIGTPALLIPSTVLVPIELIGSMDDEQLKYAFYHELTHYKRRDHVVSVLLLLLQAVYWFNPFVWIAFRQIRTDMEIACDSMVVKRLDTRAKGCYANMIVSLFSRSKGRQLVLGMAQGDTRRAAEKRVRGIFTNAKSQKSVKFVSAVLAALLVVTCFTTACQPTPEAPIVQSKDNDTVADAIEQYQSEDEEPAVIHTYSAPGTWQSEAQDEVKSIDLYVDAAVDVPTDTWGLYELKPLKPTLEDVQKMLTALVGDTTIYGEQTLESKEYLLEQITWLEAQKAEFEQLLNEGGMSEDDKLAQEAAGVGEESIFTLTDEELQYNIDLFTQRINEAKAKLPNAPDEETVVQNEFVLADMFKEDMTSEQATQSGFTYQDEGSFISMRLSGTVDTGKQNPADISIEITRGDYNNFWLWFADYDDYEHSFSSGEELYTGQELFKCDISMEEAAEIARGKLAEMGFDYLDIDTTYVSSMLDRKRKEGDNYPECFEFVLSRSMDGATATFACGDGVMTEEEMLALEYAPYWGASEVKVYVDDSGVVGIKVGTLKSDVVRQAYGVELMGFEEIMGIFETQIFIENAFDYDAYPESVINREVHIDEIRLGYMPTAWKDHEGKIIFTPVWDFFGYETVTYEEGTGAGGDFAEFLDEDNKRTYDLGNQSLLTINALDGTIMIRR